MKFNYICIWAKKNIGGEKNWEHIQAINYPWLLEEAILITANWLSVGTGASERKERFVSCFPSSSSSLHLRGFNPLRLLFSRAAHLTATDKGLISKGVC